MSAPGSPGAIAAGCKCPRKENHQPGWKVDSGRPDVRWFVISDACRMHRAGLAADPAPAAVVVPVGQLTIFEAVPC